MIRKTWRYYEWRNAIESAGFWQPIPQARARVFRDGEKWTLEVTTTPFKGATEGWEPVNG